MWHSFKHRSWEGEVSYVKTAYNIGDVDPSSLRGLRIQRHGLFATVFGRRKSLFLRKKVLILTIFVIANDGTKLMPTFNIKKVRKMLRTGRAVICKHEPFTIKLKYETTKNTQPIEFKEDTGYQNVGISVCSAKHEYVSDARILLKDEVEKHNDRRKYRRARRNRLRYRKPRFDNRSTNKKPDWLAPSLENKKEQHIKLLEKYVAVAPITSVVVEVGSFDTQVLEAVQNGKPLPSGTDYQHGTRYGYDTLREAVFARDSYTCIVCKRNAIKDGLILETHHLGYHKQDRTDRLNNLATVCTKCHNSKNHKPGGKLYGLGPINKKLSSVAFMNAVRHIIVKQMRARFPDLAINVTFGVLTKRTRLDRNIAKSHANDAYCMGKYHPLHRAHTETYQKRRRNNRVLDKFYDAKYVDIRDGSTKTGAQLSCNRTKRKFPRANPQNERVFHGEKLSHGRRSMRRRRYDLRPGDEVLYQGKRYKVVGVQHYGEYVKLSGLNKSINAKKVKIIRHVDGWEKLN
jgi:5-methylcytosine-specific restriction endonuclease McrA